MISLFNLHLQAMGFLLSGISTASKKYFCNLGPAQMASFHNTTSVLFWTMGHNAYFIYGWLESEANSKLPVTTVQLVRPFASNLSRHKPGWFVSTQFLEHSSSSMYFLCCITVIMLCNGCQVKRGLSSFHSVFMSGVTNRSFSLFKDSFSSSAKISVMSPNATVFYLPEPL